jgi:hypothetical protein
MGNNIFNVTYEQLANSIIGDETDRPEPSISPKRNRQEKKRPLDSRKEAGQSLNQKRLQLSLLPGSGAIYETESAVVRYVLSFHSWLVSK